MNHAELSYANDGHPLLKRWLIRSIEGLCGRKRLLDLYEVWRRDYSVSDQALWRDLLDLIDLRVECTGHCWPPSDVDGKPLVLIANHPYGIADGIAILSLAEQLNRPYRVLINNELLKVPEVRPFALTVDFEETEEALRTNLKTRQEALRLLQEGVTIVIFPGGGVATAAKPFGRAEELPWKTFSAKLIRSARATVLPVYFEGQNSPLFHLVSRFSLSLRLSLLIREFKSILGQTILARIGDPIPYEALETCESQRQMMEQLQAAVLDLRQEAETAKPETFYLP
ncbi:1-acyl-sn-glycerol-3-phosphate acyltransferase [Pseudovibrio brasiliensis]|uniref:1-acyl-sn-glycerol-3-phosphate acyltransferase n=1 Tax=Pseudovibrio brasiliensis TaxID=1898042 RepID=A0ABX8ALP6_9HYPH|nr:1-acyl-sn-glycerol-3-phosphate acyltransferase [Pseudovibrio brasiliensis]QUS54631.1 1-acyl-sn-glycerol-3-phosphate acyltransferase [Pseudovibrio brasiliensis]